MKDVYDLMSGLSYVALTSQKQEPEKKHSTVGEGLTIIAGFMAMFIIMLAVA